MRIMIVDDNADAAEMLSEYLRMHAHEVVIADDGPSAIELMGRVHPAVAILDIGLPGMDGYQLAPLLRARAGDQALCLVAVTGFSRDVDRARSTAAGFDAHMVKPVDLKKLLALLDDVAARYPPTATPITPD